MRAKGQVIVLSLQFCPLLQMPLTAQKGDGIERKKGREAVSSKYHAPLSGTAHRS